MKEILQRQSKVLEVLQEKVSTEQKNLEAIKDALKKTMEILSLARIELLN